MKDPKQHPETALPDEVHAALSSSGARCPELTRLNEAVSKMRLLEWKLLRSKAARAGQGTGKWRGPDDAA